MSDLMLNDNLHINNINPFWEHPPGAWSRPYKYTPTVQNTIEQEPETLSHGGDPRGVEYHCKLDRPLYPERNIDAGLWTLCREGVKEMSSKFKFNYDYDTSLNLILVLIIILLIVYYID